MPRPPAPVPPLLSSGAFRTARARQAGVSWKALQGPAYRRRGADLYVAAAGEVDDRARVAEALAAGPPGAVLSGVWAAWVHGVDVRRRDDPVELLAPHGSWRPRRARAQGVRLRQTVHLPDGDVTVVRGVPVLRPEPLAAGLVRRRPQVEAVVAADALSGAGLLGLEALRGRLEAEARRTVPGAVRGLRRLELVDPRAESPQESRLRVHLVLRGVPRPVLQLELRDAASGRVVYRLDLAWPRERVAAEYDGGLHEQSLTRDASRHNALREEGWDLRRFTSPDLWPSALDTTADQVRRALATGRAEARRGRSLVW